MEDIMLTIAFAILFVYIVVIKYLFPVIGIAFGLILAKKKPKWKLLWLGLSTICTILFVAIVLSSF